MVEAIGADPAKGKVTRYDLISVLPFGKTIAQFDEGSDVWTAFEHSLGAPTTQKDGKPVLTANGGLRHIPGFNPCLRLNKKTVLANELMSFKF